MIFMKKQFYKYWGKWLDILLQLFSQTIFPRRCPVCDSVISFRGSLICQDCFHKLSFTKSPTCFKCGKEVISQRIEYCRDCTRRKRTFEKGMALLNYNEAAKKSMAGIKYHNKKEYLDFYAMAIAVKFEKQMIRIKPDVFVPVPVHPSRKRERGFNQAEVLAEKISKELEQRTGVKIPVNRHILKRNKRTQPQKDLNPEDRLKNLQKAFCVKKLPEEVKTIILVDDIYTTGSTGEACTRALKTAGAKEVYIICICIGYGK